jgi:hypothetical protein
MGFSFSLSSIISRRKLRKSHLLGPFIFHAISITEASVLYIASSSIKGCGPEGCWVLGEGNEEAIGRRRREGDGAVGTSATARRSLTITPVYLLFSIQAYTAQSAICV